MVDRIMVYPGAVPLDVDVLQAEQNVMVAIGYALQAAYGANTVAVGLACNPTSPASMQVAVGAGAIIAPTVIESTPFGSLAADTTDPLVKMGINITPTNFTLTAPSTAGQSQNCLIQATFSEPDDTPVTLTYYNSLNPLQPYTGPANAGTPQNTRRAQRANLQLKVGGPANTGTQVTPPVDSGWVGLYIISVANGATAITSANISAYPNAPFLAAFLSSHHGGVPGQAPKINLASEVQGVLSSNNLPSAVGSSLVFAGNPNGHVAGSAASGATPPTMCWDTVDLEWWTCTSTGTTTSAVWAAGINSRNRQVFWPSSIYSFTVPAGVTRLRGTVVGGGAGACGRDGVSVFAASNGGGGGWALFDVIGLTPGTVIQVIVGIGGPGGGPGASGGNGGTSSFGSFASATGGTAGSATGGLSGGAPGVGASAGIVGQGGWGSDGSASAVAFGWPGMSGGSLFGGSARSGTANGFAGGTFGAGGSGSYTVNSTGAAGAAGIVIVEWN